LQENEQNINTSIKTNSNTVTVLNAEWSTKGGDTTYTWPKIKIQIHICILTTESLRTGRKAVIKPFQ